MLSDSSNDSSSEDCFETNILEVEGFAKDFVGEVKQFLVAPENNDTDPNQVALKLNHEMQKKLEEMKLMLERLLRKCRDKYKHNEEILNRKCSNNIEREIVIHRSYNFCGIPFFKTKKNFTHPPNENYIERRKNNEIFTSDLTLYKQRYWSGEDKIHLVQGVYHQVNQHLKYKFRNEPSTSVINFSNNNNCIDLRKKLTLCDKNFKISWFQVSSEFLHNRFSDKICEAMWNMYLRPDINRLKWTEEENLKLIQVASDNNFQNWAKISEIIGNRSELQCFVQYYSCLVCQPENINKWTTEDDEKLLRVVKKCRMNNIIRWNLVKQYFPNLTKKQLHHRYSYSIDPNINKTKFTWMEDCAILAAIEQYGENFSSFPLGLFPGRTIVQIRNRWHNTLKFSGKHSQWTIEEDKKLVELVKIYGEGNYSILADKFTNKTRSSIRQRHITIKKFFEKNPNSSLEQCPRKHRPLKTDITKENWQQKVAENLENKKNGEEAKEKMEKTHKYYNSLRTLEKEYYQIFKFSYDYTFNNTTVPNYYLSNLNFLCNLLEVTVDKQTLAGCKSKFNATEFSVLNNLAAFRNKKQNVKPLIASPSLPPSWPTLLGFRGVCIQCASTIHTRKEEKYDSPVRDTPQGDRAKDLFRKRFHLLFYKTALLSRLENCFIPNETVLSYKNLVQNVENAQNSAQTATTSKKRKLPSPEIEEIIPIKEIKKEN